MTFDFIVHQVNSENMTKDTTSGLAHAIFHKFPGAQVLDSSRLPEVGGIHVWQNIVNLVGQIKGGGVGDASSLDDAKHRIRYFETG
jgi:hypothetical protein